MRHKDKIKKIESLLSMDEMYIFMKYFDTGKEYLEHIQKYDNPMYGCDDIYSDIKNLNPIRKKFYKEVFNTPTSKLNVILTEIKKEYISLNIDTENYDEISKFLIFLADEVDSADEKKSKEIEEEIIKYNKNHAHNNLAY